MFQLNQHLFVIIYIVVAYDGSDNVDIFVAYNTGSFTNPMTFSTGSHPQSVVVVDFNNDSHLDIVVANALNDSVSVLLGYGNGSFANQITYSTGYSPQSVAVGDFDNDTILDIVVANYGTNNVGVLRGRGNNTFANIVLIPLEYGSHPFFIVIGDFNNDRKLDFAVANNGTDSLYIFLQTC
jgi:hypothetical protein